MRSTFFAIPCLVLLPLVAFSADAEWGHLRGRFVYDGQPPAVRVFKITRDVDAFDGPIEDESLIVNKDNKGIANVVIYLLAAKDRPIPVHPSYAEDATATVDLQNKNGRLSPHVLLVRTTQTILERNGDKVAHIANIQAASNPPRGALLAVGKPVEHRFPTEERMPMLARCNIHPWERAYVVVRASPYMAKTDADGRFELNNLPVGEHRFQAWHERVGYVRNVRLGPISTDSRGRFSVSIRPGTETRIEASLPGAMFEEDAGELKQAKRQTERVHPDRDRDQPQEGQP